MVGFSLELKNQLTHGRLWLPERELHCFGIRRGLSEVLPARDRTVLKEVAQVARKSHTYETYPQHYCCFACCPATHRCFCGQRQLKLSWTFPDTGSSRGPQIFDNGHPAPLRLFFPLIILNQMWQ